MFLAFHPAGYAETPFSVRDAFVAGGRFPKVGLCVLNFSRRCQTVFQKGYSPLYSVIPASLLAMNSTGGYHFGKYTRWRMIFYYFNLYI